MKEKYDEKQIKLLVEKLGITEFEAMELIDFDKGEFELEEKVEKVRIQNQADKPKATKMAGVSTQTRKIKENPTKALVISTIAEALQKLEIVEDLEVVKVEKTILFKVNGDTFEIDLKQKRK